MAFDRAVDQSAVEWIKPRLHVFGKDVGSIVPEGFEDCARVFHPAQGAGDVQVRWSEIAAANNRVAHREMQFGNVAGTWSRRSPQPSLWSIDPAVGSMPTDIASAVVRVLRPYTSSPHRCWFAIWEGWGVQESLPFMFRFDLPHRGYYMTAGPLERLTDLVRRGDASHVSVNMCWPADRSWFVSTEVDLNSTYVAGTRACINAVITDPHLEALRAELTDRITIEGDRVNPPPEDGRGRSRPRPFAKH